MKEIKEMTREEASSVRYILMDIDDTLTREGKLLPSSFLSLWKLRDAGFKVIPVTGRPAGWCDLIARQWPVDGVIGENGALVFWEEESLESGKKLPVLKTFFHENAVRNDHKTLIKIKEMALEEIPGLRLAKDQFARLFDIAIDFAEEDPVFPLTVAERIREIAEKEGAIAKVSSIHVNIWLGQYTKLSMAEKFLTERFGWQPENDTEVVFVGDSPNDEPMFGRFPLACAVANVNKYRDLIKQLPTFIASKECGDGFAEIANKILELRN